MNMQPEDPLQIEYCNGKLTVQPIRHHCIFCDNPTTVTFKNMPVCKSCLREITEK